MRILFGAAAARAGAQRRGRLRQGQVDARDVVPRLDGQRRGDGAVDAAGQRCQQPHPDAVIGAPRAGPARRPTGAPRAVRRRQRSSRCARA